MNRSQKTLIQCQQQSFLNSLFIELGYAHVFEKDILKNVLPFVLTEKNFQSATHFLYFKNTFLIGINYLSKTYQHAYIPNYYIKKPNTETNSFIEISFHEWVKNIAEIFLKNDQYKSDLFCQRVFRSIDEINQENINLNIPLEDLSFIQSESLLKFGHYAHPYPKLKEVNNKTNTDLKKEIDIKWLLVKKDLFHLESASDFGENKADEEFLAFARSEKIDDEVKIPKDYLPYPMHPLQWEILKDTKLTKFLKNNQIIETKITTRMSPTTSIRTVFNEKLKWMLKYSISARITNSIRHLKTHEVRRGILLQNLIANNKQITQNDTLKIINEPFFIALKLNDNTISEETIVVFRENPFQLKNNVISLAVLTQDLPNIGMSLIKKKLSAKNVPINQWYQSNFLKKVINPFIELQYNNGILLGAHQQNILVEFDNQLNILHTYYRDTQGFGILKNYTNYNLNNKQDEKTQNIIPQITANHLVGYYLFINSCLGTISALANSKDEEDELIELTKQNLIILNTQFKKNLNNFIEYILTSPYIKIKNNFKCSLEDENENAMTNPFALYKEINNPFYCSNLLSTRDDKSIIYTESNKIEHPTRPIFNENEILYINETKLNKRIRIRVIDRKKDLDIFHEWHNQKRVATFWELDQSKEELLLYLSKALQDPHQMPVIIEIEEENHFVPIGYFEIYWTKEDRLGAYYDADDFDRGFHLLIGNTQYLGFENTDTVLKHVCNYIFKTENRTKSIMGEPRYDNDKILRYLETFKAWERIKEFHFPHKKAVLLRCDREKFISGNYI